MLLSTNLSPGSPELLEAHLKGLRDWNFHWLLACTFMVGIGLLMELPEIVHDMCEIYGRKSRELKYWLATPLDRREYHTRDWVKKWSALGWVLIVLGVMGEGWFESQVSKYDSALSNLTTAAVAEAQKESSQAEAIAKGFDKQIAESNAKAASAEATAEAERLARTKIEAAVAWRSLDDKQKQDIGAALASFSPKAGASIWYDSSSTEAQMFADDIAEALRSGRIQTTNVGGMMSMAEGGKWNGPIVRGQTGVIIQSTNVPAAIEFASAVIRELSGRGFDVTRQKDPPFEKGVQPVVWINVEARPKGPQGEYKLQAEREAKAKNTANASPHMDSSHERVKQIPPGRFAHGSE